MKKVFVFCLAALLLWTGGAVAFAADELPVEIHAKAAVLMDQATGQVLLEENAHERLYPASVTKVMSLLLVMEALDSGALTLDMTVTASADAANKGGSQIWLKEGEQMTVDELLRATVIGSANDACTALAEAVAGSEQAFATQMNARAAELGMEDTHFENCTGLDDDVTEHLTSAYDVALMSKALLTHEKIMEYSTVWMDSLRDGKTQLVNTNKLVRFYKDTTGLKTGTTEKAGHCVSASAKRNGLHLIAVVMGAENSSARFETAKAMLNWGFANFETVTPAVAPELLTDVRVLRGTADTLRPVLPQLLPLTLSKAQKDALEASVELADTVEAPVEAGQTLGTVTFTAGEEVIATYDLTAETSVPRLTYGDMLLRLLRSLSVRAA